MPNWGKLVSGLVDHVTHNDDNNNNTDQSAPDQNQNQYQSQPQGGQQNYGEAYGQGGQPQYAQTEQQAPVYSGFGQGGQGGDDLKFKIENNIYRYRKQYGLNLGVLR